MTSRQNKARSKKKTTADAAVFVVMRRAQQCRPHAVCRRATVTRASRSKARLRLVTNRRDSWRSHVHSTRFGKRCSSSSCKLAMCGVEGEGPSSFLSGVAKGDTLFREREYPPFYALLRGTGNPPRACAEQFATGFIKPFPESLWQHKHRSPMRATASA